MPFARHLRHFCLCVGRAAKWATVGVQEERRRNGKGGGDVERKRGVEIEAREVTQSDRDAERRRYGFGQKQSERS